MNFDPGKKSRQAMRGLVCLLDLKNVIISGGPVGADDRGQAAGGVHVGLCAAAYVPGVDGPSLSVLS
ncbi:hypothetical protein [Micromonospora chersina]|uniref:hypothetical protein n=1 Tax=Micromonospora chersina TaxID=47854 RepID=UPI0037204F88